MKLSTLGVALAAFALLPFTMPTPTDAADPARVSLAAARNKNRVLLVFAPSDKDAAYQRQMKLWQGDKAGFADRDLLVMPVFKEGTPAAAGTPYDLPRRYAAEVRSFKVVLIGKDGHEAYSSDQPITTESLYSRIDAMPMRRDEMKQKQKG